MCCVFLFMALPGDPAMLTMGQRTDLGSLEAVNKELGLDKPKPVQFLLYLNDISPLSVHYHSEQNKENTITHHYCILVREHWYLNFLTCVNHIKRKNQSLQ